MRKSVAVVLSLVSRVRELPTDKKDEVLGKIADLLVSEGVVTEDAVLREEKRFSRYLVRVRTLMRGGVSKADALVRADKEFPGFLNSILN